MTAAHIIQRPLRGSRISTFYPIKSLPSLSSLDSAFQLQEYISLLIRLDVHDVDSIVSLPGTSKKDLKAAREKENAEGAKDGDKDSDKKGEIQVDQACWIYEQLRRLAQDLSHPLITTLQQECTRATCPEMKAGEWLYLCVAHGNDGAMEQCCAIDYILHTVDSATALLNSPRTFPSRLQIPQTSHRHFSSLARRLGRIFAHAYFSHREVFEQAEAESSLYARFLALTSKFDLVPAEFLVIPSGPYGGDASERDSFRDMQYSRQHLEEPSGPATIAPKNLQPDVLGIGKPKSPDIPNLPDPTAASGTVGELPTITSTSRSRFGRNRTDTMVFADVDASGVAFELAAKARAGEFDADFERDEPRTAKPATESERDGAENEKHEGENVGVESLNSDFEISLDPEEEIPEPGSGDATTETRAKEEPATPDIDIEASLKDEAVVSVTGTIPAIDSATMDEHIPATISEEADEVEPPESSVNGEVQALELDQGDIPAPNNPIEESTVTEPAAPPATPPSITESLTDETSASSQLISENPVVSTTPEDLPDSSSVSHGHHEAENGKSSLSDTDSEESVDKQTGTTGNVADQTLINEPESEAPPAS